jgi:hypothetical protein
MKGLSKYKLDKAFTEGVVIILDDAPDVPFLVKLPSPYNRAYTQSLYSSMGFSVADDGSIQTDGSLMDTRFAQEDAFLSHCLVSIDDEPADPSFAKDYPEALAELMTKANELAEAISAKVSDSVGKSSASLDGKKTGQEKSGSIQSLKAEAG